MRLCAAYSGTSALLVYDSGIAAVCTLPIDASCSGRPVPFPMGLHTAGARALCACVCPAGIVGVCGVNEAVVMHPHDGSLVGRVTYDQQLMDAALTHSGDGLVALLHAGRKVDTVNGDGDGCDTAGCTRLVGHLVPSLTDAQLDTTVAFDASLVECGDSVQNAIAVSQRPSSADSEQPSSLCIIEPTEGTRCYVNLRSPVRCMRWHLSTLRGKSSSHNRSQTPMHKQALLLLTYDGVCRLVCHQNAAARSFADSLEQQYQQVASYAPETEGAEGVLWLPYVPSSRICPLSACAFGAVVDCTGSLFVFAIRGLHSPYASGCGLVPWQRIELGTVHVPPIPAAFCPKSFDRCALAPDTVYLWSISQNSEPQCSKFVLRQAGSNELVSRTNLTIAAHMGRIVSYAQSRALWKNFSSGAFVSADDPSAEQSTLVAAVDDNCRARLWEIRSGCNGVYLQRGEQIATGSSVRSACWINAQHALSRHLAICTIAGCVVYDVEAYGVIKMLRSLLVPRSLQEMIARLCCIDVHENTVYIAGLSSSYTDIVLWKIDFDADSQQPLANHTEGIHHRVPSGCDIRCLSCTGDARIVSHDSAVPFDLVIGSSDGSVQVLNLRDHEGVNTLLCGKVCDEELDAIAVSPSNEHIAVVRPSGALQILVHKQVSVSSTWTDDHEETSKCLLTEHVSEGANDGSASAMAWLDSGIGANMLAVSNIGGDSVRVLARSRPKPDECERAYWYIVATSHLEDSVNALVWCGQARLLVSSGSNLHLLDVGRQRSMFELAVDSSGPLPDFHPACLFDWLLTGKEHRASIVLRRLVHDLHNNSNRMFKRGAVPLQQLLRCSNQTRNKGSAAAALMLVDGEDLQSSKSNEADGTPFGEDEASVATECIAHAFGIPLLSASDRIDVLAALDLLKEHSHSGSLSTGDLDRAGRYFRTSFHLARLRFTRSLSPSLVDSAHGKHILWAFHSDTTETLFDVCLPLLSNDSELGFADMSAMAAPMWLQPLSALQKRCTEAAWNAYKESKDPVLCAPIYACLGKTRLLSQLFRKAGNEKVAMFLARDFTQPKEQEIAAKNAYQLLSKHEYRLCIALFLLANCPGDAARICRSKLKDEQLAFALARLADDANGVDALNELAGDVLDSETASPAWKRHVTCWLIGEYEDALNELIHSQHHCIFDPAFCDLADLLKSQLFIRNRDNLLSLCEELSDTNPRRTFLAYAAAGMPLRAMERTKGFVMESNEAGGERTRKIWTALEHETNVRVATACCVRGGALGTKEDLDALTLTYGVHVKEAAYRLQRLNETFREAKNDEDELEPSHDNSKVSLSRKASMSSITDEAESISGANETAPFVMNAQSGQPYALRTSQSESALAVPTARDAHERKGPQSHGWGHEPHQHHKTLSKSLRGSHSIANFMSVHAHPLHDPFNLVMLQDDLLRSVVLSSQDSDELALATLRRGVLCTNLRRALHRCERNDDGNRGRRNALSALRLASTIAGDSFFGDGFTVKVAGKDSGQRSKRASTQVPRHGEIGAAALTSHPSKALFLAASATRSSVYALPFNDGMDGEECLLEGSDEKPTSAQELDFDKSGDRFVAALSSGDVCLFSTQAMNKGASARKHAFHRRAETAAFVTHSAIACGGLYHDTSSSLVLWDPLLPSRSSSVLSSSALEIGCSSISTLPSSNIITACGLGGEVCAIDLRKARAGMGSTHPTSRKGSGPEILWSCTAAHAAPVIASAVLYTPSSSPVLLTGCRDGDLRLWDLHNGESLQVYSRLHGKHTLMHPYGKDTVMQAGVTDIVPLDSGFLTCGGDGAVKLARFSKQRECKPLT